MTSPPELPADLLDQLIDTGNKALNDHYHDRACSCSQWPASCATGSHYAFGTWDTDAFAIALPAIINAYEQTKAQPADVDPAIEILRRVLALSPDSHRAAHIAFAIGILEGHRQAQIDPAIGEPMNAEQFFRAVRTGDFVTTKNERIGLHGMVTDLSYDRERCRIDNFSNARTYAIYLAEDTRLGTQFTIYHRDEEQ